MDILDLVGGGTVEQAAAYMLRDMMRMRMTREIVVPNPGAGVEFTTNVVSGGYWEILSWRALFTTSAAVATRVVSLRVNDGDGNQVVRFGASSTQAASLANTYVFAAGLGDHGANGPVTTALPTLPTVALPGWAVATQTSSLDVGDAYTGVILVIREWSEWAIFNYLDQFGEYLGRVQ